MPGPLVALVVATALQALFEFDGVATIGSAFGGIPQGLPSLQWPSVTAGQLAELVGPAFTIAMLGAIESLLSAVVADGMAGTRHDSNQELIGQGLANVLTPLFGGFAATGAIARTATNIRNGATSPLAGVVHSLTLVLVVISFAPLAADIPLAALAAVLFVVAWNMSEARHFLNIVRRAPRADVVVLLATFVLTLLTDLVIAVNIGIILATLNFMRKMADSVEVRAASEGELAAELAACGVERLPEDVVVYVVDGPFFFGAMETFERALSSAQALPRVLIIRLKWVPFIDMTGLQALEDVIRAWQRRGVRVMLSGANDRVRRKLRKAGIVGLIGAENFKATFSEALAAALPAAGEAAPVTG
ncbi:MAG: hypothetical protein KatS3mg121_1525 [Gammaproteobacteria bacterium]|nr:MAG: hypothetical protein KatS3mg121_1525 [Gammaproteobacteria bacterium]